jgi:hypothetical protein
VGERLAGDLSELAMSQLTRFERLGELTDIEDCISNVQKAVQFIDDENPNKAAYLSNLGIS